MEHCLEGWVPKNVRWIGAEPGIEWCYIGDRGFSHPFFDQTVTSLHQSPLNLFLRPRTPVQTLRRRAEISPGLKPNGLIFHMSRCGSTLVSQMLAAVPETIVISEAPPIDSMIRARVHCPQLSDDELSEWIRLMVSALGQKRDPRSENLFIKFDAWHTASFDLIRRAFPDVPWIFVYRDPIEVLVSQMRNRGAATVPGMMDLGIPELDPGLSFGVSAEEWVARFLAVICNFAAEQEHDPNGIYINYQDLPDAVESKVLGHFNVNFNDGQMAAMNRARRLDSKNPTSGFAADSSSKRAAASDEMRRVSEQILMPVYRRLESIRNRKNDPEHNQAAN